MSLPHEKNEDLAVVVEDCASSLDENDDTSTSMKIYQAARSLEETVETRQLLSNPSDADISSSDSVQTVFDADLSRKPTASPKEDIPTGTGTKLQRSPKKAFKRVKLDYKIQGEREDDSSDEIESKCFKKSAKRIKYDSDEEIADSVSESSADTSQISKSTLKRGRLESEKLADSKGDSRNEIDTKSLQQGEQLKSDILDTQSLFSKNLHSSTVQSDIVENFSDLLMTRSASKISPDKFKKAKSETAEIVAAISEDAVDQSLEAGFTHVKSSDLIAAAVANAIYKPERSPQSRTSNDVEKVKHDTDLEISCEEKEQSDADKVKFNETQVKTFEIMSAAIPHTFENLEGIKNKDISSKSTEHCSVQSVGIEKTEYSSESNLSIERMEYSSESNIDRSIETNTDIEKMDFSSESRIGFESVQTSNDSNVSSEKMDCKSESSVSREEMEIESVKSTDVEGMEYSSGSALVESDCIISHESDVTFNESESDSNEVKNIVVSNIDESLEIQRHLIPIPSILAESESNSNEVKNIIESNIDESLETQRKLSIPQVLVKSESNSNEVKNIIQSNIDESTETQREVSNPHILVKSESIIDNESESNSNEVKNITESNIDGVERKFSIPRIESSDTDEYEYDQKEGVIKGNKDSTVSKKITSDEKEHFIKAEESSNLHDEPSSKRKKSVSDQEIKNVSASNTGESTDTQKDTAGSLVEFSDTDSNEFGESKETDSKKSPGTFKKRKRI